MKLNHRRLIWLIPLGVFGVALFAVIGVLIYYLGEGDRSALSGDMDAFLAALPEQIRLGHIIKTEGGEITVFIAGERHDYHIIGASEALGNAVKAAIGGDFGQAMCVNASVASIAFPALGRSALTLLLCALGAVAVFFSRKILLGKSKVAFWTVGGLFIALSYPLCAAFPDLFPLFGVIAGVGVILIGVSFASGRKALGALRVCLATLFFEGLSLFLLSFFCPSLEGTLGQCLSSSLRQNDTHLLSMSVFLTGTGLWLLGYLWVCSLAYLSKEHSTSSPKEA